LPDSRAIRPPIPVWYSDYGVAEWVTVENRKNNLNGESDVPIRGKRCRDTVHAQHPCVVAGSH
jgi:hypothetical protein